MPESDFIGMQLSTGTANRQQKLRRTLLTAAIMIGLYVLLIAGLVIERLSLFIAFVIAVAVLGFLYQRTSSLRNRVAEAFQDSHGVAITLLIFLLAAYPIILSGDPYLIHIGALSAIYVIMALGLNITLGFAGLLDIGFAVYYGAGAYTSAQFAIHFGTNFWLGLALGGLSASLFGFVVAWPALRVHDHYLGLVTLGYGLMMNLLARNLNFLTNGTDGVINIPPPSIGSFAFTQSLKLGPLTLPFQANFYYLAMAIALLTAFVSYRLRQSPLGRSWDAIREDEVAARCSGVNTRGVKILAFSTGRFLRRNRRRDLRSYDWLYKPGKFLISRIDHDHGHGRGRRGGKYHGRGDRRRHSGRVARTVSRIRALAVVVLRGALVLLMINRPEGLFPRLRVRRILPADKLVAVLAQTRDRIAGVRGVKAQ